MIVQQNDLFSEVHYVFPSTSVLLFHIDVPHMPFVIFCDSAAFYLHSNIQLHFPACAIDIFETVHTFQTHSLLPFLSLSNHLPLPGFLSRISNLFVLASHKTLLLLYYFHWLPPL